MLETVTKDPDFEMKYSCTADYTTSAKLTDRHKEFSFSFRGLPQKLGIRLGQIVEKGNKKS